MKADESLMKADESLMKADENLMKADESLMKAWWKGSSFQLQKITTLAQAQCTSTLSSFKLRYLHNLMAKICWFL